MMAFLLRMHANLVVTALLVLGVLALWAGLLGLVRREVARPWLSVMWVAELLLLAQFVIGVLLWLNAARPYSPELHLIYSVVAVLLLPLAHLFMNTQPPRWKPLGYTAACLILCGILLRTITTGRGP